MVLYQIKISTPPLKIIDIVLSKEGSTFFRDAKPYRTCTLAWDGLKASWGRLQPVTLDLEYRKPCAIHFNVVKRGLMRIRGKMVMNRHIAIVSYTIDTWVPFYKRVVERNMKRALEDICCI